jgi:hypothetical protein
MIEAHPVSSTRGSYTRPALKPQRSPLPPPVTPQKQRKRILLTPSEGWLPLLLLAVAVYSVVYSVTEAISISYTGVLWLTTAFGLASGLLVSKSRYFPQAVLHIAACIFGYWVALILTSLLAYHVSILEMLASLHTVITNGFSLAGAPESDMIFLFYLAFLCFFLGYFGSWLIYRAHLPWLVALVYVSIMIVNLNYVARRDLTFLVVLLVAALIPLIARVQLAGQLAQWKSEGLYTDQTWLSGLTARFLRIVALFAFLILPVSWALPVLSQPSSGTVFWNNLDNAWAHISHGNLAAFSNPNSLFSPYQSSANFFGDQLSISGSVTLPDGPVLSYTSASPTTGQYLEGFTFDNFDGHTWTSQFQSTENFAGNNPITNSGRMSHHTLTTSITVLQPPGGTKHYLFAPADPGQFSVPVTIFTDPSGAFIASWTQVDALKQSEQYQVISNTAAAAPGDLENVALPGNNPDTWTNLANYPELKQYYLQVPNNLSAEVLSTAQLWTQGAGTAYDVAVDLQTHLSNEALFTYSLTNPPVPTDVDAVTWLLHTHRGYCTYFATAMVTMARLLNIPARIVNGFSQGRYDLQKKAWIVDGSDAHSWVQVYFPGFGWMNFDPTPGFSVSNTGAHSSVAPTPTATKTSAKSKATATPSTKFTPGAQPTATAQHPAGTTPPAPVTGNTSAGVNLFLMISFIVLLSSCIVLGFAVVRYQKARRASQTAIASIYARLCRVARLVGSPPSAWQTPYEYTFTLSKRIPQASTTLRRLADLFVRERWAGPNQAPDPNEQQELESQWPALRNTILRSPFSKGR